MYKIFEVESLLHIETLILNNVILKEKLIFQAK